MICFIYFVEVTTTGRIENMAYCARCGFGIGSQGHYDCCITKKCTYTRNNNRINQWRTENMAQNEEHDDEEHDEED